MTQTLRLTFILAALSMVGPLAIDTYLPAMPAIRDQFGISEFWIQQSLSGFLFAFAAMMLIYGTLSDSFGRRRVILVSLVIYILASIGVALSPNYPTLLVMRVLQGLAAGAGSVVGRAIVQDVFSGVQAQKVMSQIMMVFGLAPAIAPVLGGWMLVFFSWRGVFWFLTLFATVLTFVVWRALPESLPVAQRTPLRLGLILGNYWRVGKNPAFIALSMAVGLSFGGFSLYIGSAAQFVTHILGLGETSYAWMFIPMIGGFMLGSALSGRYAAHHSTRRLVAFGYTVMIVATALNVGYNSFFPAVVPWAVLPLGVYSFGVAFTTPAITLRALELFPANRGLASSMLSFGQMMIFALASGFLAPVLFDSALHLALGVAGLLVASMAMWTLAQKIAPAPSLAERAAQDESRGLPGEEAGARL
ncbi:multidrug effflux MFS transporter [Amphibiibacter pelophylacis]|uniref:Multidrug effflux MFS transporter n=1 Tax=Amphibiibacter pelophylacis TaxID=1799477 RepID=A0ACC6P0S2_9BURK